MTTTTTTTLAADLQVGDRIACPADPCYGPARTYRVTAVYECDRIGTMGVDVVWEENGDRLRVDYFDTQELEVIQPEPTLTPTAKARNLRAALIHVAGNRPASKADRDWAYSAVGIIWGTLHHALGCKPTDDQMMRAVLDQTHRCHHNAETTRKGERRCIAFLSAALSMHGTING